jgi:hypothetical protein
MKIIKFYLINIVIKQTVETYNKMLNMKAKIKTGTKKLFK